MNEVFITSSPLETEAVGKLLAQKLIASNTKQAFIAMYGELGVGKTAFTRGFCSSLGINRVKSPTFTIVNEYKCSVCPVYHFDMYRITDPDELYSIGYYDYISENGFCLCEWSENIETQIPPYAVKVKIERMNENENSRKITVTEGEDGKC